MANVKISELPVATSLSNGDSFPVVQGGVTKQAARSVLFASPTFTGTTTADLLTATGDVTFDGGAFVFNESGADKDARFEGDTDANLLFLDASTDRVGIGTAAPAAKLHLLVPSAVNVELRIGNSQSYASVIENAVGEMQLFTPGSAMTFSTNSAEAARITSGGNLLVGDTASPTSGDNRLVVVGTRGIDCKNTGGATAPNITAWNNATTGDNIFLSFRTETVDTQRGSIDYNRAGGLVRYNTTSDYRAKDIIGPVQNPGATIDALRVYEGVMKGATQSRPMLIAHETQAHAPYAVSGVKDDLNEDGTPKFQQMDVSSLVPLLLAELQFLRARVAALEAK